MAREPKQETSDLAIKRPLRNFEVDKYWATISVQAVQHSWRAVFDKFSWQRLIVPALVTTIASAIQFYVLGWASTIDNLKILGTSILAGVCVFGVFVIIQLVRKPCEMYIGATEEIERLRRSAIGTGLSMAEEDPRVCLEPLNAEFILNGFIAFELLTDGQRVNSAEGIVVQPIPCAPSIHFEYVDRLRMNERKRLVPTVEDDISSMRNILPELDKAWNASWEDGNGDPERVDFEFQIKIAYRDFRPRHFETTVTMKYFPLEMHEFIRNGLTGRHREYTFLKVINTEFKRLS